jgi:hypothetical protein
MLQRNKRQKRLRRTYVNTTASSRNAYASSATLIAWYFTRIQHFHGDFMSPATTALYLHVKCPIFFPPILNKSVTSRQILTEIPNIKFGVKPSSGSRTDTRGQAD